MRKPHLEFFASAFSMTLLTFSMIIAGCASPKALNVMSHPAGADVYIKGFNKNYFPKDKVKVGATPYVDSSFRYTDETGKIQMVEFSDLGGQEFFVILEKDGYEAQSLYAPPYFQNATLKPDPGATLAKKLSSDKGELGGNGSVRITSTPTGAKLYINSELVGNTPYSLESKEGKYQLTLKQNEFESVSENVTIVPQKSMSLHFDLRPMSGGKVAEKPAVLRKELPSSDNPRTAQREPNGIPQ